MTGFGLTRVLLEHNPIPRHPWITPTVVREEVAIQTAAEDEVQVFNTSLAQEVDRIYNPPREWS